MRQSLVPVLLLAAVALSSSNVLPLTSADQPDATIDGQQYDNIFSNRYNTRNPTILDTIFYTVPVGTSQSTRLQKKIDKYMNTNNNRAKELNDVVNEEDNYDDEGFRQEQWHNYPRQLDRLHEYLLDYHDGNIKQNIGTDDPGTEEYDTTQPKERSSSDIITNEYLLDNYEDKHNTYESVLAATNPYLILKVHLTCLNNRLKKMTENDNPEDQFHTEFRKGANVDDRLFKDELNPATKVKREGVIALENEISSDNSSGKKKTVNKRLFSLWSRLQSLSHKGHELPHRRHLAFYGFPDSDGGGTLTAETRATMMRPPGSPLRWG